MVYQAAGERAGAAPSTSQHSCWRCGTNEVFLAASLKSRPDVAHCSNEMRIIIMLVYLNLLSSNMSVSIRLISDDSPQTKSITAR